MKKSKKTKHQNMKKKRNCKVNKVKILKNLN